MEGMIVGVEFLELKVSRAIDLTWRGNQAVCKVQLAVLGQTMGSFANRVEGAGVAPGAACGAMLRKHTSFPRIGEYPWPMTNTPLD